MRPHWPYTWGRRSSGFPVTHQWENFSFQMGMGFHLPHMEKKAVGWGTVQVKAEMKNQTKPINYCQSEMERRWGNCYRIILGNTLSFHLEHPHFSLKVAAGCGMFYIALLVNSPFLPALPAGFESVPIIQKILFRLTFTLWKNKSYASLAAFPPWEKLANTNLVNNFGSGRRRRACEWCLVSGSLSYCLGLTNVCVCSTAPILTRPCTTKTGCRSCRKEAEVVWKRKNSGNT